MPTESGAASPVTTTVIGSLPRPAWLVRDDDIRLWRLTGEALRQGKDDAARLAIRDQETAGVDVITDGEQRRMHYISRFVSSLSGIDAKRSNYADVEEGTVNRASPVVTGDVSRKHAHALEDLRFLKAHTDRRVKMTMPGPMTAMYWLTNEHYACEADLGMAMARVLHEEMLDLQAAGCDVIQLDEPQAIRRPDAFREWGRAALDLAFEGIEATTCVHFCLGFPPVGDTRTVRDPAIVSALTRMLPDIGSCRARQFAFECESSRIDPELFLGLPDDKQVVFGLVDVGCTAVEDPRRIAARIKRAVVVLGRDRVWAAPDCGLVWLPIDAAREKLRALVEGARLESR